MKLINIRSTLSPEQLIEIINDQSFVNEGVKFGEDGQRPVMKINGKGTRLFIRCEMVGGATRDNGFIVGTSFVGRVKETESGSTLRGIITTAPLYHAVMLFLIGLFIYQCISLGGISIVPICIATVGFLLTKNEYKKQGIIERYLHRAVKRGENR